MKNFEDFLRGFYWKKPKNRLFYVSDNANWAINWYCYYLTRYFKNACHLDVINVHSPWTLNGELIHFFDRYAALEGRAYQKLSPSNHVFLTWFHGNPELPKWRGLFDELLIASNALAGIVVSCKDAKSRLVKHGIHEDLISMIPLGVDIGLFQPPKHSDREFIRAYFNIPKNAFCIGSFQKDGEGWEDGLTPKFEKGPDVFLETVAYLRKSIPELFVLLTGPARGFVMQGLRSMGVPYSHHNFGNYFDIVKCYHALDAYIIASRDEGGPNSLLESWATGVPVASTRMGMPADLIEHGRNGFLAEIGDARNLANDVIRLKQDNSLRRYVINEALQDSVAYDWSTVAQQYYDLLYFPYLKHKEKRHKPNN